MNRINTSFKPNLIVSLLTGGWLFLFIILIKPFQIEELSFSEWFIMATGHGLIASLSYLLVIPLQDRLFKSGGKWCLKYEVLIFTSFYLIVFVPSYFYNQSNFINGVYALDEFFFKVFLPSLIVVTPVIYFARINMLKISDRPDENEIVVIKGDYKLDYLKISLSNLVCASSAQNYVDIFYLENGSLHKKTLRTSLKKIESTISPLRRVHRSHLINPEHVVSWKNSKTISLTQIEIPVGKSYKEEILSISFNP